jgi:hypothetical protein
MQLELTDDEAVALLTALNRMIENDRWTTLRARRRAGSWFLPN